MRKAALTPYFKGKPYHAANSGYEALANFVQFNEVFFTKDFKQDKGLWFDFRKKIGRIPIWMDSVEAERAALSSANELLHHFYCENTFYLSRKKSLRKGKKIVVTLHQPVSGLEKMLNRGFREGLKGCEVITISPSQEEFLKRRLRQAIHLIPHGIDCESFKPVETEKEGMILSVGSNLRDFGTLLRAFKIFGEGFPNTELIIVSNRHELQGLKQENVRVLQKVSDKELLGLYNKALFQVLSLEDATTNNALLEGMACSLPSIVSDFVDTRFYTQNRGSLFFKPGNSQMLAEKMRTLFEDSSLRERLSAEARKRALQLDWRRVSGRVEGIYEG